ncbi:hypothetical protein IKD98_03325 [Candidatus Saccharibacteria bacterium]|nr:hypothetical protein [Candidatus Saccharibacteria bacterium]
MALQEKNVSEPIAQIVQPEVKKCNHTTIIVILVILAIGCAGFGGFELWQNMKKDDEIKVLQAQNNSGTDVGEDNSDDNVGVVDDGVKEEIIGTLKKFQISIEDSDAMPMYTTNFVYEALDNFTKDFKDRYTAWMILHGDNAITSPYISYEGANDMYHSLFSDTDDLGKKEYNWYCRSLVYDSVEDVFNVRDIEDCGVGGYTSNRILYKIDSIENYEDKVAVRINSVLYNVDWGTDMNLEYQPDPEELINGSLASHVLYFGKNNDSYVLVDIK